jgi:hypothetical protein
MMTITSITSINFRSKQLKADSNKNILGGMQMLRNTVNRLKMSKFVKALGVGATLTIATSTATFAASPAPVVVNMAGSGAGFTTTDLLTNTSSFLTQYAPFIVLVAAIIFAKPLLNFVFFVLGKIRGGSRA